jgi:glycosyltransferase A (GT-A) superfamily protein (DUF2064 family)
MTALVVIAKDPVPGRVKTRLQPELSLDEAAVVAAALISDTLATARTIRASRHIVFWDGNTPPAGAAGFELIAQPQGSLDERLAALFDLIDEPMVLIGMDTPQFSAQHLGGVFPDWPTGVGAVFGPAEDGGFWALGMREPRGDLIRGVPMSRADTGARQIARLHDAGLLVSALPMLLDVDDFAAATRVAEAAPAGAFAAALRRIASRAGIAA